MEDSIQSFFQSLTKGQIFASAIVVIISILVYKAINFLFVKGEKKFGTILFTGNKGKTYLKLFISIIRNMFIIGTILILLDINGVDISAALTGVGIFGIIMGLALQDWLKDIIRGGSIISDGYFTVGDIVKYKDIEGKVLVIGLKSTKIQELKNGYIKSIANRNIEEIDIVSHIFHVDAPMPYELPLEKAEEVVNEIVEVIKKNENVEDCVYEGINELDTSFIQYHLRVECNPQYKLQVRRDALGSILTVMEQNNISVPYTQIDVHQK